MLEDSEPYLNLYFIRQSPYLVYHAALSALLWAGVPMTVNFQSLCYGTLVWLIDLILPGFP